PSHRTYCTWRGSFRPSSARRRVRSSCVACEPSMISAGSPGERCSTMKTTSDTPASTCTSSRSRCPRQRFTAGRAGCPSPQRDRLDPEIEARVELEPLHALGERGDLDLVVDEDPRRVVVEDALRLAVQLG